MYVICTWCVEEITAVIVNRLLVLDITKDYFGVLIKYSIYNTGYVMKNTVCLIFPASGHRLSYKFL